MSDTYVSGFMPCTRSGCDAVVDLAVSPDGRCPQHKEEIPSDYDEKLKEALGAVDAARVQLQAAEYRLQLARLGIEQDDDPGP